MNKDQLKQILMLFKEEKITTDEALDLIEVLDTKPKYEKTNPFKNLKIFIADGDADQVNLKVPLEFTKLLKINKFKNLNLDKFGVDIDSILKMINQGVTGDIVNITSKDGETIVIKVE